MRAKQAGAIVICVAIVIAAYLAWYRATEGFNPIPATVTLDTDASCSPSSPPCPAFRIDSANLTVKIEEGITSQLLTLNVSAEGPSRISSLSIFFSSAPIGNLTKVILPGKSTIGAWAIPTTFNVTAGNSYVVFVEAQYVDPSSGQVSAEYWSSTGVLAA